MDIFELRPLIVNFNCKLSAISDFNPNRQLLCLVSEKNEIVLRYTSESGQVLKLINFFRRTNRAIHDACFNPSGEWLLVLCFDNTLHIIPALAVVDRTNATNDAQAPKPYSTTQVTSYIIPFVGPHECPNSKKCPNQNVETINPTEKRKFSVEKDVEEDLTDGLKDMHIDQNKDAVLEGNPSNISNEMADGSVNALSHDLPASMIADENYTLPVNETIDKAGNSQVMLSSFMVSSTCPYPLSVIWWQTMDGLNRAIIGYSDGSICFVGLSPNCPFIASTAVESGSVMKLLICKDNTFESVMLMITSSLKVQYKLLLEQKAIKYVYPGDTSPATTQTRDSDWQIVMAIKSTTQPHNSVSSDPASDSSQCVDEEVFNKTDERLPTPTQIAIKSIDSCVERPPPPSFSETQAAAAINASNLNQMPPPPPYSVAINRHSENSASVTTMAGNSYMVSSSVAASGVRFPQQQMDFSRNDGNILPPTSSRILPAARARLSSLKSLGSKKLNAIKSRLYDNRQKMEEYLPGNNSSSFAIMDSPSLTPEVLSNSSSSFFTLQNLRNTYLISALHSQSNMLTVHTIDANLRPLFSYKIPKNCYNILISSNILYAIQYVALISETNTTTEHTTDEQEMISNLLGDEVFNTEKESRDTDTEKQANYAEAKLQDDDNAFMDKKNENQPIDKFVNESAHTNTTNSRISTASSPPPLVSMINAVSVLSSAMASCGGHDMKSKPEALLALFRFENETVLKIYQMATYPKSNIETTTREEKAKAFSFKDIRSPLDYVEFYSNVHETEQEFSLRQMEIMQNEFPKVNYDPCYVITNKNVFYIQLKKEPFTIFLEAALASDWKRCREFCNIFDLSYETCIEFAGDYLLRRNKISQALLTYNSARVKPIRTALKLAMFGHTNALMHLSAMALKITYVLKSQYFCSSLVKTILNDITYRHSEDVRAILPKTARARSKEGNINEGNSCSDYTYGVDEILCNLQMSPSSQFHLANLLLITLAEKAVNDKNYIPLWNFLAINTKYHTNMTSIVLCQSGLYSSALILAKVRGVWMDTFVALTSVLAQEFGWYTELNVCLYNLSEPTFAEIITYMPHIAIDYFGFIQEKMDQIRLCVLKRLEQQLNPFSAALRPIVSHTQCNSTENNSNIFSFCKHLIETYLAVLTHLESHQSKREQITNALSTFRITYEDNQFAIESSRFKPISAGCAHCACVIDGIAYFWGSNGVPCIYSANKSAEPPEPPHAVKSLDLLSQLDLEVHTVKCGRQHTLILTNNGLYALGNNHQMQLGVGRHTQVSLQPMLVEKLDGKNITILEAGQYHNAALADDMLYTWGWGVYGQLGHGDAENVDIPKIVSFFKFKKVLQVSLGHGHSLVLCQSSGANATNLYVFGSNHFGQLGIGTGPTSTNEINSGDEFSCANQTKSTVPIKLDVSTSRLRLVHTKFFTNLAVDENGKLYTWGSSPQALRLANQIKRRANAKQKFEEQQRRDMSKQFESDIAQHSSSINSENENSSNCAEKTENIDVTVDSSIEPVINTDEITPPTTTTLTITELETDNKTTEDETANVNNEDIVKMETLATVSNVRTVTVDDEYDENVSGSSDEDEAVVKKENNVQIELLSTVDVVDSITNNQTEQTIPVIQEPTNENSVYEDAKKSDTQEPESKLFAAEADPSEHMTPHLVDTSEVAGQILQLSSGLFHFALISSTCTLYTWGKNLEHQLGTEDKERRAVNKPMPIDNIESPMYVDCGADFTIVMTTEYVVKAFGGNSNGQCGRDLGQSLDKMKQRVVCLPTTKRLMRFESQCIEMPVDINLPRPGIHSNTVRYLKSLPRFQLHFVQEADISFHEPMNCIEQPSIMSSQQYNLSSDNTRPESDDLISSLENFGVDSNDNSSYDATSDEQHSYARFSASAEYQNQMNLPESSHINAPAAASASALSKRDSPSTCVTSTNETCTEDESTEEELKKFRHYVHYCLYVFHGLYNPDRICELRKERLEYRIRVQMLNFKFVDAFNLCLEDCGTTRKALKVFEYYSKDTSFVPMRRQDLKYLIYYLMQHFINKKFDMLECERFFLDDLDFYLIELAYVLYFNNNNTVLEQNLNQKFKNLIAQEEIHLQQQQQNHHHLEDAVIHVIFDSLSVKFKTVVCQKILRHCMNN